MMLVLFLWVILLYVDFRLTRPNMTSTFNGYCAIVPVLDGEAKAPTQYRVLVPWLYALIKNDKYPVRSYLYIRWVAMLAALFIAYDYFYIVTPAPAFAVTLLTLFFIWVALFDYTDIYIEIAILTACLLCFQMQFPNWGIVIGVLCLIGGLNRETVIIVPLILAANGYWIELSVASLGCFLGLMIPRRYYGKRERYDELVTIARNFRTIKANLNTPLLLNEYFHFLLLAIGTAILFYHTGMDHTAIVITAVCVALIIPTKWNELRVFAPISLVIVPMLARWFV